MVEIAFSANGRLELACFLKDLFGFVERLRLGLQESLRHRHAALERHVAEDSLLGRILRCLDHALGRLLNLADQALCLIHDVRLFGGLIRTRDCHFFVLWLVLGLLGDFLAFHRLRWLECDARFHHGRPTHLHLLLVLLPFACRFDFFCDSLVIFFAVLYKENVFGFVSDFFL